MTKLCLIVLSLLLIACNAHPEHSDRNIQIQSEDDEGHHLRDHQEDDHQRSSESGNVRTRNGEKHDIDITALVDKSHVRGEDWNGDNEALLTANYVDDVHVRGQDKNGEDELSDDDEHIRGQDWNGDSDIAVDSLLALEGRDGAAQNEHQRGQNWDGDIAVELLVALEEDEHVRGEDWNGEKDSIIDRLVSSEDDEPRYGDDGHHEREHEEEDHELFQDKDGNEKSREELVAIHGAVPAVSSVQWKMTVILMILTGLTTFAMTAVFIHLRRKCNAQKRTEMDS